MQLRSKYFVLLARGMSLPSGTAGAGLYHFGCPRATRANVTSLASSARHQCVELSSLAVYIHTPTIVPLCSTAIYISLQKWVVVLTIRCSYLSCNIAN